MYEKYYNRLLDYRISGMDLPYLSSNVDLETAIAQFVEQAKIATANPKVSAFVIPQKFIGGTTDTYMEARKQYIKELIKILLPVLSDNSVLKVGINIKSDMHFISKLLSEKIKIFPYLKSYIFCHKFS